MTYDASNVGLRDPLEQNVPPVGGIGAPSEKSLPAQGRPLGPLSRGQRRRDVAISGTTLIQTSDGPRAVSALRAGDMVETLEHGAQPLVWVGRAAPAYQLSDDTDGPIRIRAGALGKFGPQRTLTVLADQRILIQSQTCAALLGQSQFFVAARHLLHLRGVGRAGESDTEMVHLMLGTSAVIRAQGAWVEAWRPDSLSVRSLPQSLRNDLCAADSGVLHAGRMAQYQATRPNLNAQEARRLLR